MQRTKDHRKLSTHGDRKKIPIPAPLLSHSADRHDITSDIPLLDLCVGLPSVAGRHVRREVANVWLELSATYVREEFLNMLRCPATNLLQSRLLVSFRDVLRHALALEQKCCKLGRTVHTERKEPVARSNC
jgi:hypothetical protein